MGSNLSRMAFSEKLEKFLEASSKKDLSNILKQMGFDKTPSQREDFLKSIKSFTKLPEKNAKGTDNTLLDDIDSLKEEIEDCNSDHCYEYCHEEDELGPLEEFVDPFAKILDRSENVFECGDMDLASKAYVKIFELTQVENDYGHRIELSSVPEVDEDETKARYIRSMYCVTPPSKRCKVIFELMERLGGYSQFPSITSVAEILTTAPPEWEEFLEASFAFLSKKEGNLYDHWLREATLLIGGVKEIAKLAKKDGTKRPRTFVSWLDNLDSKKEPNEVFKVCKLALKSINEKNPIRATIADRLEEAADVLGNEKLKHQAVWEGFLVKPELSRLIKARIVGCPMDKANEIVEEFVKKEKKRSYSFDEDRDYRLDSLEDDADVADVDSVHSNIFAGNWSKAFELAKKEKNIGWSGGGSTKALFIVLSMVKQINKPFSSLPKNLSKVWSDYGNRSFYSPYREKDLSDQIRSVYQDIFTSKGSSFLSGTNVKKWVATSVEGRVKHIVSNNHRKAYERAANIAGAYCELLEKLEGKSKAKGWASKVKNWFPRHSAFQRELRNAIGSYI